MFKVQIQAFPAPSSRKWHIHTFIVKLLHLTSKLFTFVVIRISNHFNTSTEDVITWYQP